MPLRFGNALAPCIEAMPSNQKSVRGRMPREGIFNPVCECIRVLAVLDDGQPLGVFVCGYTLQTLEHLVPFKAETAVGRIRLGEYSAPNRVGVQNRRRSAQSHNHDVELCLRRRPPGALNHSGIAINLKHIRCRQCPLIDSR